jgi:hypothetical protein
MDVLDSAYVATGFSFSLVDIVYVLEPSWRLVKSGSESEYDMKSSLRRGNYAELNIYIDSIAPDSRGLGILGYA